MPGENNVETVTVEIGRNDRDGALKIREYVNDIEKLKTTRNCKLVVMVESSDILISYPSILAFFRNIQASITELELRGEISAKMLGMFLEALKTNTTVTNLLITSPYTPGGRFRDGMDFDLSVVKKLAELLRVNKKLASITISGCGIGYKNDVNGIGILADALQESESLTKFTIEHEIMKAEQLTKLMEAVKKNKSLAWFSLRCFVWNYKEVIEILRWNQTLDVFKFGSDCSGDKRIIVEELIDVLGINTSLSIFDIHNVILGHPNAQENINKILKRNGLIAAIGRTRLMEAFYGTIFQISKIDQLYSALYNDPLVFYKALMFEDEQHISIAIGKGLLTIEDCEKINEIRQVEISRLREFPRASSAASSGPSATASTSSASTSSVGKERPEIQLLNVDLIRARQLKSGQPAQSTSSHDVSIANQRAVASTIDDQQPFSMLSNVTTTNTNQATMPVIPVAEDDPSNMEEVIRCTIL